MLKSFYAYKINKFLKRKRDKIESLEKPRKVVVRKYDPEYIKYEFISAGTDLEPTTQRVECAQILSREALKPSKLQRHLDSKHPEVARKPKEYFERKRKSLQKQQGILTKFTTQSKLALKVSCRYVSGNYWRSRCIKISNSIFI